MESEREFAEVSAGWKGYAGHGKDSSSGCRRVVGAGREERGECDGD